MSDISPPRDLKPALRYFPEVGEEMVNADGIIAVMQTIDTPKAKALYRAFRRHLARVRLSDPDLPSEKQRGKALLASLREAGVTFVDM